MLSGFIHGWQPGHGPQIETHITRSSASSSGCDGVASSKLQPGLMSVSFISQVRASPRRVTFSMLKGVTENFCTAQVNEDFSQAEREGFCCSETGVLILIGLMP